MHMQSSVGKLKAISLFSGAGGLDVGVDSTGEFELLAAVELEEQYCETLRRNRDAGLFGTHETKILQRDISELEPTELLEELGISVDDVDVLIGGPPCQSFSTAGRRGTVNDPRGTLIWDFLRFVEAFRPKMFLMENVRGLLSAALKHRPIAERPDRGGPALTTKETPGSVVKLWADDLSKINDGEYRVDVFEVNAVNYGAPQIRERVLFIGNRLGHVVEFPDPTHGPAGTAKLPFRTLRDALAGWEESRSTLVDFSPRKKRYLDMIPEGGNWRTLPEEVAIESMGRAFYAKGGRSGWWRRLSWDLPCPTITTLPNHSSTSMCHPTETRVLSVGEFSRVQEFPDGWTFSGRPQQQMTQVGNAVPPRLGAVSGKVIAEHIRGEAESRYTLDKEAPAFRRVYLDSHVRTRTWWKKGQAYVRDSGKDRVAA